jgi:hypothetical protein
VPLTHLATRGSRYCSLILRIHIHLPFIVMMQLSIHFTLCQGMGLTADSSTLDWLQCRRKLLVSGAP